MSCKDECMKMMEEMKAEDVKDSMSKMMMDCACSKDFKDMMDSCMETMAEAKE